MKFNRTWAMPSRDTFSVPPIGDFVRRYLKESTVSVDPFARNCELARFTNDLNPETKAQSHLDAEDFLKSLQFADKPGIFDLVLFDAPYSPRQISECYQQVGREVGMAGTQNGALYLRVRNAIVPLLAPNAIVLSFGWNSSGMGKERGFEIQEILLVCHGGAHNDTICMAERMLPRLF
jgi:hypothetical protein